jgi:Co/Zn/Cd efflux system component
LLDIVPSTRLEAEIRRALEGIDGVRVFDLHLWSLGGRQRSCMITIVAAEPREPEAYRATLSAFELAHLTIEVRRCVDGHAAPAAAVLLGQ